MSKTKKLKHKILIVDDEKVMIDVLMNLLSDEKYDVEYAMTGKDGLKKLGEKQSEVR